MIRKIKFFDSTLRDGSHAIKHKLSLENIENYCLAIDGSGVYTSVIGHGNGLGASSLQVGKSLLTDSQMLSVAKKNLCSTRLGAYMIPGFGTIKDNIVPAISLGVDIFLIGSHCTEADTTKQHIEYLANLNKEVYGVLMMYHMASTEKIIEEAKKMEDYGASGIIIMDSAGASTPELVRKTICSLYESIDLSIGFHSHNNLGLAVANAYLAIEEGASIIDGTICGFGAGAGNCQLESLIALLEKSGVKTGVNLYQLLDVNDKIMPEIMPEKMGQDSFSIVSGMAGIFSAFKPHILRVAKEYNIDPRIIAEELGKRKVIAGQEDMIIEVAEMISGKKASAERNLNYQVESLL